MDPKIGAIFVVVLALWALALRESWRAMRPPRLLLNGRYDEARLAAEALERSWIARVFASIRLSARYTIASALHLEGKLEASLETFERIRREESRTLAKKRMTNLRYAIASLEAANLVLLDRDPARIVSLLEKAVRREQEDVLLLAHAKHAEGKADDAHRLFLAAGRDYKPTSSSSSASGEQERTIFHALRGLYLLKIDRKTDARRDLEIASGAAIVNVYVTRASERLTDLPSRPTLEEDEDGDGPSSLAPQVVESEKNVSKG